MRENPHLLLRGLAVWGVIILVESLHGTARELWLRPLLGDFRARQISVFTAMALILLVALLFARWLRATQRRQLLAVGALWVLLTVAFEFGLGRFVLGYSWTRLLEDYNLARGGLMGLGLVFLLFAPLLAAKMRDLRT
ncbi:MAG TPA: hypothetical protein PLD20_07415 [Blastocatellia bacterium]|nr:hypothetical protein [Blastocatellia bacterium]HMV85959.1 hypothetical protein [Blastocatellia bacterium]HMX26374.1 hypothetical protein [Blastocatellia bacterium]HMZ17740.1 hypothetical protein [Blastocatellia bacterium]HNG34475.1 hypothetical protein [Blastocatellia bacterium]